jgi:porin
MQECEAPIRREVYAKTPGGRLCCPARIILCFCFCFLPYGYAARPGFAQTAEISPATPPNAPTLPEATETTNPPAQPSPIAPPSQVPIIVPLTNPAIISPQAQLDYDLQIPLFGELPLRKELAEKGIDLIAHYISQTASNTAGVGGTGTSYAQQVDFGFSFDLDKLGIWPDAIARYAMTDRAGTNLANRTGSYFPYQSIYGQGQNLRFNEISVEKFLDEKQVALIQWATILPYYLISATSPTMLSAGIQ